MSDAIELMRDVAVAQVSVGATPAKKIYSRPELRSFGAIGELTRGSGGTLTDGSMTNQMASGSDASIKQNVAPIGKHPLGIGLYLFDYKPEFRDTWGHGRQFGVIAQEVEAVMPDAVSMHADGYRVVDYAMLGIRQTRH